MSNLQLQNQFNVTSEDDIFYINMYGDCGEVICSGCYMKDKSGNAVVIQLDTPEEYRGNGYATRLLADICQREGGKPIRVISNDNARGFYNKLGYKEISPYVFQSNEN